MNIDEPTDDSSFAISEAHRLAMLRAKDAEAKARQLTEEARRANQSFVAEQKRRRLAEQELAHTHGKLAEAEVTDQQRQAAFEAGMRQVERLRSEAEMATKAAIEAHKAANDFLRADGVASIDDNATRAALQERLRQQRMREAEELL